MNNIILFMDNVISFTDAGCFSTTNLNSYTIKIPIGTKHEFEIYVN